MGWKIEIKYLYFTMACSNCKKRNEIKQEINQGTEFVSKGVIWFVIIWSLFALYGIYTFIRNII